MSTLALSLYPWRNHKNRQGVFLSKWLSRRLTPAKSKEARWAELAAVTEQIWEEFFDPDLSRLERLRSSYLADDQDLVRKIRQMGDYFSFELPNEKDRPIALAWRRLELEYKDTELILRSVFRRHFGNLAVTWFPIFAPLDKPYGTVFTPAEGPWPETKNIPPEDMFLTSRGVLGIDLGCVFGLRLSKREFLDRAEPLLLRTKPLHIVYDGPLWYIRFDIPVEVELSAFWERESDRIELPFAVVGSRFDFTAADVRPLDTHTLTLLQEHEDRPVFHFVGENGRPWHLDWHIPEGFPPDWLPLDFVLTGTEGENVAPFRLFMSDQRVSAVMPVAESQASINATERVPLLTTDPAVFAGTLNVVAEKEDTCVVLSERHDRLDHYPRFDECPADLFPLDMPIGGAYV